MQPDTTTFIDLCSSSSKRLVLRRFLLHEAVSTTGFNALAQDHLASNLTTAINKMTSAQKNLTAGQRGLSKQMSWMNTNLNNPNQRFHNSIDRRGYQSGKYKFF